MLDYNEDDISRIVNKKEQKKGFMGIFTKNK
jgi:hypothetical protein